MDWNHISRVLVVKIIWVLRKFPWFPNGGHWKKINIILDYFSGMLFISAQPVLLQSQQNVCHRKISVTELFIKIKTFSFCSVILQKQNGTFFILNRHRFTSMLNNKQISGEPSTKLRNTFERRLRYVFLENCYVGNWLQYFLQTWWCLTLTGFLLLSKGKAYVFMFLWACSALQ